MKKSTKPRSHQPPVRPREARAREARKRPVGQPERRLPRRGFVTRSLWIEIVFFVAVAAFGFSAVIALLNQQGRVVVRLAPSRVQAEPQTVAMLYEAPSRRPQPEPALSPIFTPSVQHWEKDILRWAEEYDLDPNLIATVMQIESCGDPQARSYAGASGLFQVMPFHFTEGEDYFDPDTNALRGMAYLTRGLELSGGHAGLALAGYNGGHGVISRNYETWPRETQRYYRWGSGIYREAAAGWDSSPTLAAWLTAGGQSLCSQAEARLNIQPRR